MATHGAGGDTLERLELGSEDPARGPRPWSRTVVALALGGLLGWVGAQAFGGPPAPQVTRPPVVVSAIEEIVDDPVGPDFLVGVYNPGPSPFRILGITPQGWDATMTPVSLGPGSSLQIPIDISLD